jgi:aldose 1-epimerase
MDAVTLTNAGGMEVRFIAYGGAIVSIRVPDRNGVLDDVTPGYDSCEEYHRDTRYFGVLIGRYANRVAGGRCVIDGTEYTLSRNDGVNHLHGGACGFDKKTWRVARLQRDAAVGAVLSLTSPAGDQGYPGTLDVRVTYTLTNVNELIVDYEADTDTPTIVNLTQHSYFNLAGQTATDVLDHELTLGATYFTPVDAGRIPTGERRDVRGTPFDFTTPHKIGERLCTDDEQLRIGGGYDHNFVLNRRHGKELAFAARLYDSSSGRALDVFTTEPGVQVYSGNLLDQGPPGKGGRAYARHAAVALETQHFPDSPNHPDFPSTIVRPDHAYRSRTVYRFSTRPTAAS